MNTYMLKGFALLAFGAIMLFGSFIPAILSISTSSMSYSYSGTGIFSVLLGLVALVMFCLGLLGAVAGVIIVLSRRGEK